MFELVFSDSVKGSMWAAKNSEALSGALHDVESLWLELDIGDLHGLPDIECRKGIIFSILEGPEGATDDASNNELWECNMKALRRAAEAGISGEDVRIWWSDSPAETCGLYFAVSMLEKASVRVTSIKLPPYFEEGENICVHDSLKSLEPQKLAELLPLERDVSPALRRAISVRWRELAGENAPLRAVVNERLISVPADFYDYTLRRHFPDGVFTVAYAIGKTMGENQLGISDWWYAQRVKAMIKSGELEIIEQNSNFYLTSIRKRI